MNKLKTLSGAQLKYIAFTTMLIDHVNKALIYPNLNDRVSHSRYFSDELDAQFFC